MMARKLFCLVLIIQFAAMPVVGYGKSTLYGGAAGLPTVLPNALPQRLDGGSLINASLDYVSDNKLIVNQEEDKAIIDWDSFDIGRDASTHFDQQGNSSWSALNRIHSADPTQILGKLTADGKIYLINQNGILFGPNSRVNVHSLVASSLNITNENFLAALFSFQAEQYFGQDDSSYDWTFDEAAVVNRGDIQTDELGSVLLLGAEVANGGTINSPSGQIGLATGSAIDLKLDINSAGVIVEVSDQPGFVFNEESGSLIADAGMIGMYGAEVYQEGLARTITAVQRDGKIELCASERIVTGPNSRTLIPISDSKETVNRSFFTDDFSGTVSFRGLEQWERVELTDELKVSSSDLPAEIVHYGEIVAPSGQVSFLASDKIHLASGSLIDVGGLWVEKPASEAVIEVTLNSVELRDDYGQKGGLLQGETVTVNPLLGSAVGDISGYLDAEEITVREASTKGGTIYLQASSSDNQSELVVMEGATIEFSGGGIQYTGGGAMASTKVLSGVRVYDISELPQYAKVDEILGSFEKVHKRYGIVEKHLGVYSGGANPLLSYSPGWVQGSDAGELSLIASQVLANGNLSGTATAGYFQVRDKEWEDEYGNQTTLGWRKPELGTLNLGIAPEQLVGSVETKDPVLQKLVVQADSVDTGGGFSEENSIKDLIPGGESIISAEVVNSSGVGTVQISAVQSITIAEDATIALPRGGEFEALSPKIVHLGVIKAPSGSISFTADENKATYGGEAIGFFETFNGLDDALEVKRGIFLGANSSLSASGETVDNYAETALDYLVGYAWTDGGTITLTDKTGDPEVSGEIRGVGVIAVQGSSIDVSGGHEISDDGTLYGGDAGTIKLQGNALVLDGELIGQALPGNNGGEIILHANEVAVAKEGLAPLTDFDETFELPEEFVDRLVLADDRFKATGFTRIELASAHDLTFEEGVTLKPSLARLDRPDIGMLATLQQDIDYSVFFTADGQVSPDYIGESSIRAFAGKELDLAIKKSTSDAGTINIGESVLLQVSPGGVIELDASNVNLHGTLQALAGEVSVKAGEDLKISSGARILAGGYNKPGTKSPASYLEPDDIPMDAGSVELLAENGEMIFENGAVIDVSAAAPVSSTVLNQFSQPETITVSGNPGEVKITTMDGADLQGAILAHADLSGLSGGTFSLVQGSTEAGLEVSLDFLNMLKNSGFDDLTMQSYKSLDFGGDWSFDAGRHLTLDAPELTVQGNSHISLTATWLELKNTSSEVTKNLFEGKNGNEDWDPLEEITLDTGGTFELAGDWLDVEGQVVISGAGSIRMRSEKDIRFSDHLYEFGTTQWWGGDLLTTGNIEFQAQRLYPTTLSKFDISTPGTITISAPEEYNDGAIYSAAGKLSLIAGKGIEHYGVLAVPFGQLALEVTDPAGVINLYDGSLLSVQGASLVSLGAVETGDDLASYWYVTNHDTGVKEEFDETFERSITARADKVVVGKGAELNTSGGGTVFGYQFISSVAGTKNPFSKSGRYVLVPGIEGPGEAVYLDGNELIDKGVYSILPEEYAFLPGAMVIEVKGAVARETQTEQVSEEGYALVQGYFTELGTDVRSEQMTSFSIRSAKEVLSEGTFSTQSMVAGNGGDVTISGSTTEVNGTLVGGALAGYDGGTLSLSGRYVAIKESAAGTSEGLEDYLVISGDALSRNGFSRISLGDAEDTITLTIGSGVELTGESIALNARDEIVIESMALIEALSEDGKGIVSLTVAGGLIDMQSGSRIHASDRLQLEMADFNLEGDISVDSGTLELLADSIRFMEAAGAVSGNGLNLTQGKWNTFSSFRNVILSSRSDIEFHGDFALAAEESLSLNAGRIAGIARGSGAASEVTLSASSVRLYNSSGGSSDDNTLDDQGVFNIVADQVKLGSGDVRLDGFSEANLTAQGDVVVQGAGSLSTDADITLTAARVTASHVTNQDGEFETADYSIATSGGMNFASSDGENGDADGAGGKLSVNAETIILEEDALIQIESGTVALNATGMDADDIGIHLEEGAEINVAGNAYAPGGEVHLEAESGSVTTESGSVLDVSAGAQGDAGSVYVSSLGQAAVFNGELRGQSMEGGMGGTFDLDTFAVNDFSNLNDRLNAGGFDQSIKVRARTGDLDIAADDHVVAENIHLTTDQGGINVGGVLDADTPEGSGAIELNARDDIRLLAGSELTAGGTGEGSEGGDVRLTSTEGWVRQEDGSRISSYGNGGGGGLISINASRIDQSGIQVDLQGTVAGASKLRIGGTQVYENADGYIRTSDLATYENDAEAFVDNLNRESLLAGLTLENMSQDQVDLVPVIEILSDSDLALATNWDLSNWANGTKGLITLKAAANLNINSNLVDHPTAIGSLHSTTAQDSWEIQLIAGADLDSANPLATVNENGDLNIALETMVYTESGGVRFASGGDTNILRGSGQGYMIPSYSGTSVTRYNLGSYSGDISGNVGGGLNIDEGAIQTAVGNIDLYVKDNVDVKNGAIRTTGEPESIDLGYEIYFPYYYGSGGSVSLVAGGDLKGSISDDVWEKVYTGYGNGIIEWGSRFGLNDTTEGVVAMNGGDVFIKVGGSFTGQAGTFGEGDFALLAGDDVNGRFLIADGYGRINTFGEFGDDNKPQVIELLDASIEVSAQGDIYLGTILNPTVARSDLAGPEFWNLTYGRDSAASFQSVQGSFSMTNKLPSELNGAFDKDYRTILPAKLVVDAAKDIYVSNSFILAPSEKGNLTLVAGEDIEFEGNDTKIVVSDIEPEMLYGTLGNLEAGSLYSSSLDSSLAGLLKNALYGELKSDSHADYPVHKGDETSILVSAGNDIRNMYLVVSKAAEIKAGNDINGLTFLGQNANEGDITMIRAGGDILSNKNASGTVPSIRLGGPGALIVQAGGDIDLGTSLGIQSLGSSFNVALPDEGADIYVLAGLEELLGLGDMKTFFDHIHVGEMIYGELKRDDPFGESFVGIDGSTETFLTMAEALFADLNMDNPFRKAGGLEQDWDDPSAKAEDIIQALHDRIILPFLEKSEKVGNLNMTSSQISSVGGGGINIFASGDTNVGQSTFFENESERKNTGIYTSSGGSITLVSQRDINVNESRIMTFRGGDITCWSEAGDINAGRGSRTAISVEPPKKTAEKDKDGNIIGYKVTFEPPAVGSGIRAMTYDPDGFSGSEEAPEAGNIYITAWNGIVDAGEAGIEGSTVAIIGEVVNAQNISFSKGSVGFSSGGDAGAGLGAITGTSDLANTGKLVEDVAGFASKNESPTQVVDDFLGKWLDVEVIEFDVTY